MSEALGVVSAISLSSGHARTKATDMKRWDERQVRQDAVINWIWVQRRSKKDGDLKVLLNCVVTVSRMKPANHREELS